MVETFEDITAPLTEDELTVLPYLIAGLEKRTSKNPIRSPEIVKGLNANLDKYPIKKKKFKITGTRLRKMINHLRINSICPVMATSDGYFTSTDPEEIERNIRSLKDRARAILAAADGLNAFLVPGFKPATLFDK